MLELPRALRFPKENELPDDAGKRARIKAMSTAQIEEGFIFKPGTADVAYRFFAAINIGNSRLWDLFTALCKLLPEEVGCICGMYNDDLEYSEYIWRDTAMEMLATYQHEIVADCNLQLGLVNSDDDAMVEVFISEVKYISFWGMNEEAFRKIMSDFSLQETSGLQFMDEFPTIATPLTRIDKNARSTKNVVAGIQKAFQVPSN